MRNQDWDSMNELDFDSALENSVLELPPDDIVEEVTPWKKSMNRILIGMALNAITLNFFCLNYILPTIGMVLSLLGFRALRLENKWFKGCFLITVIRAAYIFPTLILNTTIIQSTVYASPVMGVLSGVNLALQFVQFFFLWLGLRTVQQKVNLPPHAGSAVALMIWYALIYLLALVQYNGLIIAAAMVVGYIFIIRSLCKLSKELDEAGYTIQTAPVKCTDRTIVIVILALLLIGGACGYLFGGSYPMEWTAVDTAEHAEVDDIKDHLASLGFPKDILKDLTAEDIAACEGALQVVVDVHDYPVNAGRTVRVYQEADPSLGIGEGLYYTTVYDVKELQVTGIAVELPGDQEQWKIFHHFLWTVDPGFYGTESIQLWPAYRTYDGWGPTDELTGRILYDKDGKTFTAPYTFLGDKSYTSSSTFWGESLNNDVFATFSMHRGGENYRGYLSYTIVEMNTGYIVDSYFNYTHQMTWMQYPAFTAMEKRIADSWKEAGAFLTIQDALQFYPTDEGAKLLSE